MYRFYWLSLLSKLSCIMSKLPIIWGGKCSLYYFEMKEVKHEMKTASNSCNAEFLLGFITARIRFSVGRLRESL